jgi:hypothetical protein
MHVQFMYNVGHYKQKPDLINAVFCDMATRGSCKNRRFGGTCRLHLQDIKIYVLENR